MRYPSKAAKARTGATPARLAARMLLAVLTLLLHPAFGAGAAAAPLRNPGLASLQIEIWPEYDRPATLVILRAEIAADTPLPAEMTLRIPAASGGPSAMAYSTAADGNLLNLEYQRTDAKEFIALHFKVPARFFHVEFYDPLATATPERSYTYVWPGDLEVKRFKVMVQEPAAASNFSVQPNLDSSATGQDGLRFRSAQLGAQAAGRQLPIKLRYIKTDMRTSVEMVQPKTPDPAPAPAAPAAGSSGEVTKGVLVFILAFSLLIATGAAILWWRGRAKTPADRTGGAGACAKCGTPRAAAARYCSNCGARLK